MKQFLTHLGTVALCWAAPVFSHPHSLASKSQPFSKLCGFWLRWKALQAERKDFLQCLGSLEVPLLRVSLWTSNSQAYFADTLGMTWKSQILQEHWLVAIKKGNKCFIVFSTINEFIQLVIYSFKSFKIQNVYNGIPPPSYSCPSYPVLQNQRYQLLIHSSTDVLGLYTVSPYLTSSIGSALQARQCGTKPILP